MAENANLRIFWERDNPTINAWLNSLFNVDRSKHSLVAGYFALHADNLNTHDFVVICDDLTVTLESDPLDSRGG